MNKIFRSNRNIVFCCHYHLVWCTKYRKKLLNADVASRLFSIVEDIAEQQSVHVSEIEVMPDHVQRAASRSELASGAGLLVDMDPQFGVTNFVKVLRGVSSRLLRSEFPFLRRFSSLWTNSCFIATVGGVTIDMVKKYIGNQKTAS